MTDENGQISKQMRHSQPPRFVIPVHPENFPQNGKHPKKNTNDTLREI